MHLWQGLLSSEARAVLVAKRYARDLEKDLANAAVPFQFTLPIMCALYYDILGDALIPAAVKDYVNTRLLAGDHLSYRTVNPPDYREALEWPLRAIAYFSWEPASRLFLARRVYPTYFDFLSYSHCHEGWGALGHMLHEVEKSGPRYQEQLFSSLGQNSKQKALPFMAEITRLKYGAAMALPVADYRSALPALHGAFLLFFKEISDLPAARLDKNSRRKLRSNIRLFVDSMREALEEHSKTIISVIVDEENLDTTTLLARLWRKTAYAYKNLQIVELSIQLQRGDRVRLEFVCSRILAALSGPDFHAILEKIDDSSAVILVAGKDGIKHDVIKPSVLRAVGAACADFGPIRYRCERVSDKDLRT